MAEQKDKTLLLEVKDLYTSFFDKDGIEWKILDGINLKLYKGQTLGILGPSGVGKSVLALSIFRLIRYPGKIVSGEVFYKGKNLFDLEEEELNDIRGKEIALVMQNAPGGMDPLRDVTYATSQPYKAHTDEDPTQQEIKLLVVDQLGKVALPEPLKTSDKYAHQMSGGESQRVKIATALMNNPEMLIADEPVANLDLTVARQILDLLIQMKEKFNLTMIFIAHNLGVIAEIADTVAIMYGGKIVEIGTSEDIFYNCKHPFTQGLFYASPDFAPRGKLKPIPGVEPQPANYPSGCHFHPRCQYAISKCSAEEPPMECFDGEHFVACWCVKDVPNFENEY